MTYANVVATLALFLVLGGGTALASYVVSSNSQIGPNTVSGHKPPSGKHSNIIPGSVSGRDLATGSVSAAKLSGNSVNSSKVANGSLLGSDIHANTITGSNLNLANVSGALRLRSERATINVGAAPTVFYNAGPFTLTGSCGGSGPGFHATITLASSIPAFVSIDNADGERFTGTESTPLAQSGDVMMLGNSAAKGGEFTAAAAPPQFTNHLSGHVMAIADGVSPDTEVGTCVFTFEGIGT